MSAYLLVNICFHHLDIVTSVKIFAQISALNSFGYLLKTLARL